jgi:predicted CopG family antitoxin
VLEDAPTTITVRSSTLKALSLYKIGKRSYDEVLRELMEEVPPTSFLKWAQDEVRRPVISLEEARKRLGLPGH